MENLTGFEILLIFGFGALFVMIIVSAILETSDAIIEVSYDDEDEDE